MGKRDLTPVLWRMTAHRPLDAAQLLVRVNGAPRQPDQPQCLFAFDGADTVYRFVMPRDHVAYLVATLSDWLQRETSSQSAISAAMPKAEGSPAAGHSQCPLTMSSIACKAVEYEPKGSPANDKLHQPSERCNTSASPFGVLNRYAHAIAAAFRNLRSRAA